MIFGAGIAPVHPETREHSVAVHWEMFSVASDPLMGTQWGRVDDPMPDGIRSDAPDLLGNLALRSGQTREDQQAIAIARRAVQYRFRSEWSHTRQEVADRYGYNLDEVGEELDSLNWWSSVAPVLNLGDPRIWHYNPVEFLLRLAGLQGTFVGTANVRVLDATGQSTAGYVRVTRLDLDGQPTAFLDEVDTSGTTIRLPPGHYRAELFRSSVQQGMQPTGGTVWIEPAYESDQPWSEAVEVPELGLAPQASVDPHMGEALASTEFAPYVGVRLVVLLRRRA